MRKFVRLRKELNLLVKVSWLDYYFICSTDYAQALPVYHLSSEQAPEYHQPLKELEDSLQSRIQTAG